MRVYRIPELEIPTMVDTILFMIQYKVGSVGSGKFGQRTKCVDKLITNAEHPTRISERNTSIILNNLTANLFEWSRLLFPFISS